MGLIPETIEPIDTLIRTPHDCLIAQTAIEYGVFLLQDDVDFERIAMVEPLLSFVDTK